MIDRNYSHSGKVYVEVTATFKEDGRLIPLAIVWEDGRRFAVDRVADIRPAASLKAGGCGVRYTCVVCGKPAYLYFEEDRWFMECRTGGTRP